VRRRRGGICYELNGVFAHLLSALGYTVELLPAQVCRDGARGPRYGHLALRVTLSEPVLVDVGFADESLRPTPWRRSADDSGGYQLRRDPEDRSGLGWELVKDDRIRYWVEVRPQPMSAFAEMCHWHQNSPESRFTRSLICTRATEHGRLTLSERQLIETVDGRRTQRLLPDDNAVLAAYRQLFGIALTELPHPRYRAPEPLEPAG
jgi:N-hydroxyarylamine O-acetyltransferase